MAERPSSRERLQMQRAALVAAMRTTTPADPSGKGARKLVIGALSVLTPRASLLRKLARCGRRNETNDSRQFCGHPACAVCTERRADWLFSKRLWPALERVPATRLRWITVLMFARLDLDDGISEMARQHRRLQHVLRKFAGGTGKNRKTKLRVWGAREAERVGEGWMFHVHLLVDLAGGDPRRLGEMLRTAWGHGSRQVQIKVMQQREHRANIIRLAHYMTKARYTRDVDGRREWLSTEDIVTLALWRDRLPAQWHRFNFGIRGV
jgi:hypothetical protein